MAAALLTVGVTTAMAGKPPPSPNPCASGTLATGVYSGFTVTGTCKVAFNAQVTVNGTLTLADGSVFNGLIPSSVHVTGDVKVGAGALLALGYATKTDVVDGNVVAKKALSIYLGFVVVHGDVNVNGGGTSARFYNLPLKDDTIDGNLTIHGWIGGWVGVIRVTVGGNVDISKNMSVVQAADGNACDASGTFPNGCDAAPGGDTDSTEVMSNNIAGDLSCSGNSPAAQINPADGGGPNTVGGTASGECQGLTTANPCATGTLSSGTYNGFTVYGACKVAFNAQITINGDLDVANGGVFGGIIPSTVHVTGDVYIGKGSLLGLGYATKTDVVDGSIVADQPLSIYLGFVVIHGDVVSNGGGTAARFYNMPIKDDQIDGNLSIRGYDGGWLGVIRVTVGGSVEISNNASLVQAADPDACDASGTFPNGCDAVAGGDTDSTEVMSNNITGNLSCKGNSPAAQINPADGGGPNTVGGNATGECAGLTTANGCATGTLASGTYNGFTVTGTCSVAFNAQITINGNLKLAPGAVFAGIIPSSVHITGNVRVGNGALLGLGYATKTDVVDGNINADQPLSVYLGFVTIHGNVSVNGGGTTARFYNMPIKDDQIDGNLTIQGWTGGWVGVIRVSVGGNVNVSNNSSVVQAADGDACDASGTFPAGCVAAPGSDTDSTEVMSNTIGGNLSCNGNSPAAQINPADGGGPNTVGGNATGECAGLTTANPCATGTLPSGTYNGFTVSGRCSVAFNAQITVNGDLTVGDGAVFAGIIPSSVHVTGDVNVGKDALLGLGYATKTDVVDGNITANQPRSLYLGFVTIHGNVTSNGGGTLTAFYNFPIKDNVIDGDLTLDGWTGGWIGAVRNTVGGNVDISNNTSAVQAADPDACDASGTFPAGCPAAPGGDMDSTEVMTNTIGGNLTCKGNSPAAQVNPADGGQPNVVGGKAKGECAGLTT
jgi:hypothetical protein